MKQVRLFFTKTWSWPQISILVIVWRIFIEVIHQVGLHNFPYSPTFPYALVVLPKFGPRFLTTWAQFDGVHYLTIITKGYLGTDLIQAFFPLYPLLVKNLSLGIFNPIFIGICVSILCFTVSLYFLYKLICLDSPEVIARKALLLVLIAPTSLFFTSLYTESLFFLLIVGTFYAARKGNWWIAGIVGAAAAATRIVGIFLIPALIYEYFYQQSQINNTKLVTRNSKLIFLSTLLPSLGLGSYMLYLKQVFNDPLLFIHAQNEFGTSRDTKRIILLYQVIYRYIKMFLSIPIHDHLFYTITQEFLSGILGLVTLIIGWFITRPSYIIFAFLAYITPTLTGTFSSLPRYILPLFPIFIVLSKIFPKYLYLLTVILSAIMLIINVLLFTQGLWVA